MYAYLDSTRNTVVAPFGSPSEARQHALDNECGRVTPIALELVATARMPARRRGPEVGSFAHFVSLGQ